jgi:putative ABC transport system permease protein
MTLWSRLQLLLRATFHRSRMENEMDVELRFHIEAYTEDLMRSGISREEATRRARIEFGGIELVKEEGREARGVRFLDEMTQDLRYTLRTLRKTPGFTAVAVFTLALGIGATTSMFSVVYNLLVDPFPYKHADRLAVIHIHDLKEQSDNDRSEFSVPEFLDYRQQNHVFEDMIGEYSTIVSFDDGESTRRFGAAYVTGNTFEFFGVPPLLGRGITPEDAKPDAAPVFVISGELWKSEFSADTRILGKSFLVDGRRRTLVGIMPPRFYAASDRPMWMPLALNPGAEGTAAEAKAPVELWAVGRLKPGITLQAAISEFQVLAKGLSKVYPKEYPEQFTVSLQRLADDSVGQFKVMLYVLLGAVAILLLIACSNVANLLLAKATTRGREIAVRLSLGASPSRLVRQLLAESVVLAGLACLVGCILAYFGLKGISAAIPLWTIPREAVIGINPVVLVFAAALSTLTTLICGLMPAIHAVRGNPRELLAGIGRGGNVSLRGGSLRSALVIVEVALSVVLLVGAGLLTRSFVAFTRIDLGFSAKQILFAQIVVPQERKQSVEEKKLLFEQVLPRVKALPGVLSVAAAYSLPPSWGHASDVTVPGRKHAEHWYTRYELCSTGYFETLGLHLLRGRILSDSDIASARHVMVANETLARRFFPGMDPIGQKIKLDNFDEYDDAPHDAYFEIVGVVADFSNWDPRKPAPLPEALLPYTIFAHGERIILARVAVPPDSLLPAIRREIWAVDPKIAITWDGTLQSILAENSYIEPRFYLSTTGAFAVVGLLLVVIGVFSVMAYTVSLRTQEIGIRMALGAVQGSVLKMVLAKGFRLIAAGALIGLLASLALTRFIASQIWGITATDPTTFVAVAALVALVGFTACWFPARRAMRVDPMAALRYE